MELLTIAWRVFEAAFGMFWETLWPLVLGFALSGAVQAFVNRSEMQRVLGDHGPGALLRASVLGAASSSCSYAASAMAKSLFQRGADLLAAVVFMLASTNLVIELGLVLWILLGWQFTLAEYVGGAVMIALVGLGGRYLLPASMVEAARARLASAASMGGHEHAEPEAGRSLGERLRSPSGWADAAGYTFGDLRMVWRELVAGYVLAGALAVLVPEAAWNVVFLRGHGPWTSIENVLVGPLVAVVSFVCSIGNVPLAAALWSGGISFGGVVSFVFADLITMPLLLIYRRYYGLGLTIRLAALMYVTMAVAGLVVEFAFGAAGLVPAHRSLAVTAPGVHFDATFVLNLLALGVVAALAWLARNRGRFGDSSSVAFDPICGMQVMKATAPATRTRDGLTHYFCSDRCADRFDAGGSLSGMEHGAPHERTGSGIVDPVCGMEADPATAPMREHAGRRYFFCSEGCAEAFARDPNRYLAPTA